MGRRFCRLCAGSVDVGETGDYATRTLAAVGNTIDVARHLVAQHSYGEIAQIVVSEAVMIVAGLDTRVASMRDIVLPSSERLQVIPIDGAAALFGNPEQTSLS